MDSTIITIFTITSDDGTTRIGAIDEARAMTLHSDGKRNVYEAYGTFADMSKIDKRAERIQVYRDAMVGVRD